jgi:hypothetical protein
MFKFKKIYLPILDAERPKFHHIPWSHIQGDGDINPDSRESHKYNNDDNDHDDDEK